MSKLGGTKFSKDTDQDASGTVTSVSAGTNVTVTGTATDPIINASASGGQVDSVVAGTNVTVNSSDPVNPVVSADAAPIQSITAGTNMTNSGTASDPILDSAAGGQNTTKGDLEGYDTGSARIPVGTNDQVLTADSTAALGLAWKNAAAGGGALTTPFDGAKVSRNSNQTVSTTSGDVLFQDEDYDDNSFADLGTDDDRFTIPEGVTRINFQGYLSISTIDDNSRIRIEAFVYDSGDTLLRTVAVAEVTTGRTGLFHSICGVGIEVAATDYIKLRWQNEDSTCTLLEAEMHIQDVTPGAGAVANVNSFHGALIERSTDLSRNATPVTADFIVEVYDTDDFADIGTNDDRLTVPAGVTKVQLSGFIDPSDTITLGTDCYVQILHFDSGDSFLRGYKSSFQIGNAGILSLLTTGVIPVAEGDYFQLSTYANDSSWTQQYVSLSIEYKDGTLVEAQASVSQVELAAFIQGVFGDAEKLVTYVATKSFALPVALATSQAYAEVVSTAAATIDVQVNGVSKGSINFATATAVATFTFASEVDVVAGDRIQLIAQGTADATLADVSITLRGTL